MFRILIIDDDRVTRNLLQRILSNQGYEVHEAADGSSGIDQANRIQPGLILCDWIMPGVDGITVCHEVKANPKLSATFFIMLTTHGATEDVVAALDAGADDFLSKPLAVNELKARVRAGLRIHQLNRDLQQKNQTLEMMAMNLLGQKQMLEREFLEAAEYMRSMLPPPMSGDVSIESRFIPSRQLGGDCFDYYWLDPDYLMIYLLDVSGHGLGATLLSVTVLNMLRSQSLPGVNFYQPQHVLSALNETFQMTDQNEKYFTIWYGVYNHANHQLVYASAGHPPPVLLKPQGNGLGQASLLKQTGVPIGMLPSIQFTTQRCHVDEGSTLYLFSDGAYEIRQPNGDFWEFNAFVERLTQLNPTPDALDDMVKQIQAINPEVPLADDLSLLQIQFE